MSIETHITNVMKNRNSLTELALKHELESMSMVEAVKESHVILIEPNVGVPFIENCFKTINMDVPLIESEISKLKKVRATFESSTKIKHDEGVYVDNLSNMISTLETIHESKETSYCIDDTLKILREQYDHSLEQPILESVNQSFHSREELETLFALEACRMFMQDDYEVTLEDLNVLNEIAYKYTFVMESISEESAFRRGKENVGNAAKKTALVVKKGVSNTTKVAVKGVKGTPGAINRLFDNTVGRLNRMNKNQRRSAILNGGMKTKISKSIKYFLTGAVGFAAAGPVVAGIAMLTAMAMDRKSGTRVRVELIKDMEQELKITKEKIRDADAGGDKQSKYQLMRIEEALERDILRVQRHQENELYRATDKGMV